MADVRRSKGVTGRMFKKISSMINVTKCSSRQSDQFDQDPERCLSPLSGDAPTSPSRMWASSPNAEMPSNDYKKTHKPGKGPVEKRRSVPSNLGKESKMKIGPRSSSQPVLVAFLPQYVNKLKANNFTLKEKMTRWCKKSPNALIKKHLPPEDHYLPFPAEPYEDMMNDEFGRSLARVALESQNFDATVKPRVEVVLERYPAGRHDGLLCSFDRAPGGDRYMSPYGCNGGNLPKSSRTSQSPAPSRPPPPFDGVKSRMFNRPSADGAKSPVPSRRPEVLRVPTDTSLLPMGLPARQASQELLNVEAAQQAIEAAEVSAY